MGIKVIRFVNAVGEPSVSESYGDADHFFVKDGHLHVEGAHSDGSRGNLAIFTPGKWQWAEVEQAATK